MEAVDGVAAGEAIEVRGDVGLGIEGVQPSGLRDLADDGGAVADGKRHLLTDTIGILLAVIVQAFPAPPCAP